MKKCRMCGLISGPSNHDQKESYCRPCSAKRARDWYAANTERAKVRSKAYRDAHRQQGNATKEAYFRLNPLKRRYKSWKHCGIDMTPERYEKLLHAQNFSCAICRRHESEFQRRLAVDHNHDTGQTRGLLCTTCNSMVVVAVERFAPLIPTAFEYLKTYSEVKI